MPYSIITVIYGTPIHAGNVDAIEEWGIINDLEKTGLKLKYHMWSGDGPIGYWGVTLGEFDECCHVVSIINNEIVYTHNYKEYSVIPLTPSHEQMKEAEKILNKIPQQIREKCLPFGIYFVFSTS